MGFQGAQVLHAVASGSVSIILAIDEIVGVVVFEFLLKRKAIKFTTKGKLTINFFLADVESLHIKES